MTRRRKGSKQHRDPAKDPRWANEMLVFVTLSAQYTLEIAGVRSGGTTTETGKPYHARVQLAATEETKDTKTSSVHGDCNQGFNKGPSLLSVVREVFRVVRNEAMEKTLLPLLQSQRHYEETTENDADAKKARELLGLGSVWILSPPSSCCKGTSKRASDLDSTMLVRCGVVIRVHAMPCRFLQVYDWDWSRKYRSRGLDVRTWKSTDIGCKMAGDNEGRDQGSRRPGVIVHEDTHRGYAILYKPAGMPVHATVYNGTENVVHMFRKTLIARRGRDNGRLRKGREDAEHHSSISSCRTGPAYAFGLGIRTDNAHSNDEDDVYVTLPQRLDNDTSGLLVVSTKRSFASYMSSLLERKTLSSLGEGQSLGGAVQGGGVCKKYKCLVCLPGEDDNGARLSFMRLSAMKGRIVIHFMDPRRGPLRRIFADSPSAVVPDKVEEGASRWRECRLRLLTVGMSDIDVGNADALEFSSRTIDFADWRWAEEEVEQDEISLQYMAVTEVEVELLTGRTHQIRGQFATMGFPLVGDAIYGGKTMSRWRHANDGKRTGTETKGNSEGCSRLALHCSEITFSDPDVVLSPGFGQNAKKMLKPSKRMNAFRLSETWWTSHLR